MECKYRVTEFSPFGFLHFFGMLYWFYLRAQFIQGIALNYVGGMLGGG